MAVVTNSEKQEKGMVFVDLDGTLLATDTLWESLLLLFKKNPFAIIVSILWLFKGKAYFKQQVSTHAQLNPDNLPIREKVLLFLQEERAGGKQLILATAADQRIASAVANFLGIFSATLASDGLTNLTGGAKLRAIRDYTAGRSFAYLGNSRQDIPIWQACQEAHIVSCGRRLRKILAGGEAVGRVFKIERNWIKSLARALRIEQWIKNLLLFVPLVLAHELTSGNLLLKISLGFVSFSLCASGGYILNDMLDLESDRRHPRKRHRPFASGALPLPLGISLFPILILVSIGISLAFLPNLFTAGLLFYLGLSISYSLYLKRLAVIDVLVLAYLYTHRILLGAFAGNILLSPWLLAFSIFFFLNLAYIKRYGELIVLDNKNLDTKAHGRGYNTTDKPLLRTFGTTSGYLSVLVLALYINSEKVSALYRHPEFLWVAGLCLLYWITRLWLLSDRGEIEDDPLLFTIKDRTSYVVGIILAAILFFAI